MLLERLQEWLQRASWIFRAKSEIKISGLRRGIKEGEILKIEDLMNQIDLSLFNEEMYNENSEVDEIDDYY